MALYAAMFIVLDRITLFHMPQGGSVNLSSVALLLASYHLGWKNGLLTCVVANGLLYVTGSMNFYSSIFSLFFDYLFAYCGYAFASVFPNIGKFYSGVLITNLFRLLCSTLSGIIAFGSGVWPSLEYNGSYMIPVTIIGLIVVPLLMEALRPVMKKGN